MTKDEIPKVAAGQILMTTDQELLEMAKEDILKVVKKKI